MYFTINSPIVRLLVGCTLLTSIVAQPATLRSHIKHYGFNISDNNSTTATLAVRATPTLENRGVDKTGQQDNGLPTPTLSHNMVDSPNHYIDPYSLEADFAIPAPVYAQYYGIPIVPDRSRLCIPVNYYTSVKGIQFDEKDVSLEIKLGSHCEHRCDEDPQCQSFVAVSDGVLHNRQGYGQCYFYAETFIYPDHCPHLHRFFFAYTKPFYQRPANSTDSGNDVAGGKATGFSTPQDECRLGPECAVPGTHTGFVEQPCFPKYDVCVPRQVYDEVELPDIDRPFEPKLTEQCQMLCNHQARCNAVIGAVVLDEETKPKATCYLYERRQQFPTSGCQKPSFLTVAYYKREECPRTMFTFHDNGTVSGFANDDNAANVNSVNNSTTFSTSTTPSASSSSVPITTSSISSTASTTSTITSVSTSTQSPTSSDTPSGIVATIRKFNVTVTLKDHERRSLYTQFPLLQ